MGKSRSVLFALATAGILTTGIVPARAALQPKSPQTPVPFNASPAARDTEPVVLTGASFPTWAAPADLSAKVPATNGLQCYGSQNAGQYGLGDAKACTHNQYEQPDVTTGATLGTGVPINKLLGYRWNPHAKKFVQIPFQVD